jgi:SET domain-containing protein
MYPQLIIELRPSTMLPGEIGLFAVRSIRRGCVIAAAYAYSEEVAISWDRWRQLDPATRRKLFGFCPGDARGIHAPPDLNRLSVPWFCNHSCDPNAAFDAAGNLVAAKYIRGGTEITWDYGTLEKNPGFRMVCKCGSPKCRKIIRASP